MQVWDLIWTTLCNTSHKDALEPLSEIHWQQWTKLSLHFLDSTWIRDVFPLLATSHFDTFGISRWQASDCVICPADCTLVFLWFSTIAPLFAVQYYPLWTTSNQASNPENRNLYCTMTLHVEYKGGRCIFSGINSKMSSELSTFQKDLFTRQCCMFHKGLIEVGSCMCLPNSLTGVTEWGGLLLQRYGKQRYSSSVHDPLRSYLGYFTDTGAFYWVSPPVFICLL